MEKKSTNQAAVYSLLFAVQCLGVLVAALAYGQGLSEVIRASVSAGIGAGILLFLWEDHALRGDLPCDNGSHPRRFFCAYLASFAMTMFMPLIVADSWPFVSVYVLLSLLSCPLIGVYAGTELLMLTILVQGGGLPEFFMYVFAGFIAVGLFRRLDEQMHGGMALFISLLTQTVLLVCYHVMFLNEPLSVSVLIVPIINAFINFALLIMILNAFSFYVIRRDAERYAEINDPAYALMLRIRETSETEYQRAIHTDYLTQRVAAAIGLDQRIVRCCSYYHRAAIVLNDRDLENNLTLYRTYHFPEEAIRALTELITHKKGEPLSAEATVITLCETMIASLQFMFQKNSQIKVDYALLVDKIFEKKESEGEFLNSALSVRGLRVTRELLKKETLYYDFLR
ncbi:MAG: hypothetical protein K5696_12740 [Lachnospiraceae bacterium]|nr:hypothetical protein [Lachnospiraceae bacterium]